MDTSDLCKLHDLTEEALLQVLYERFSTGNIYTSSGLQLISINPFARLDIYSSTVKDLYKNISSNSSDFAQPHIYLLLEECIANSSVYGEHSIIISGESGSGKTECARYILDYLGISLMKNIDFILESLGNARTIYNDNSSRFGKLVSLKNGNVSIETFLLEKSRVTGVKKNSTNDLEYNFHILYYILAGHGISIENDYISYNHGSEKSIHFIECYQKLKEAFFELKIDFSAIEAILLAIVKIGSIEILDTSIVADPLVFKELNIEESVLTEYLLYRVICVKDDKIYKKLNLSESITYRDSIARLAYKKVFEFVVKQINLSLNNLKFENKIIKNLTLNILDIFGFENFDDNGLDQFCINWCNEKIYDQFVDRMFDSQIKMLEEEGIEHCTSNIEMKDSIISQIEKPCGIVDLIGEESLINGNASNLQTKISQHLGIKMLLPLTVQLNHFAGSVNYNLTDFVNKNSEKIKKLDLGKNKILSLPWALQNLLNESSSMNVVSHFRSDLTNLFKLLNSTTIKYIKCIKPNLDRTPMFFDSQLVLKQLQANGILQSINLSKSLYNYSMYKEEFIERYGILANENVFMNVKEGKTRYFFNNFKLKKLEKSLKKYKFLQKIELAICEGIIFKAVNNFCIKQREITQRLKKENDLVISLTKKPFVDKESEDIFEYSNNGIEKNCIIPIEEPRIEIVEHIGVGSLHTSVEELEKELKKYKSFSVKCTKCAQNQENDDYKKMYTKILHEFNILQQKYKIQCERLKQIENNIVAERKESCSSESIEFISSSNIFHCVVQLYFENIPKFTDPKYNNVEIPKDEIFSMANCINHILEKLEDSFIEDNLQAAVDSLSRIVPNLDLCKAGYILTNIIELKSILLKKELSNLIILDEIIDLVFFEYCNGIIKTIKQTLPDSILEHQQIKELKVKEQSIKDKLYKKVFTGPTIDDFIKKLDNIMDISTFYYIPDNFIQSVLGYVLGYTDFVTFNSLIIKKNFMSFNRCAQISYNLAEIGKQCFKFGFMDYTVSLGHITEAVRISTIVTAKYHENLLEECYYLNELQKSAIILGTVGGSEKGLDRFVIKNNDSSIDKFIKEPIPQTPIVEITSFPTKFVCPKYIPKRSIKSILRALYE